MIKEKLYNVKYSQLSVFAEAKTIDAEMTVSELKELLDREMITLLEVNQAMKDGSFKYSTNVSTSSKYNPDSKGYNII